MQDLAIVQAEALLQPPSSADTGGGSVEPSPAPETKHERFLRLAPKRVQGALDALDRVGKLSLPENEYSEQEAARIVCALRGRLDEVEHKLGRKKPEKRVFSFD